MREFDELPKSVKKAIRYIKQDAPTIEHLKDIELYLHKAIKKRTTELKKEKALAATKS